VAKIRLLAESEKIKAFVKLLTLGFNLSA